MARGHGGRPKAEDGEKATRQIRVFTELADMIGDLVDLKGGSAANLVDDWIRPHLKLLWEMNRELIEQMKKTRAAAQKKPKQKG